MQRMPFPVERYDACVEPHTHLRCEHCGRVLDLELDYDGTMDALAAQAQPGIRVSRHDLIFYGLCPQCQIPQTEAAG